MLRSNWPHDPVVYFSIIVHYNAVSLSYLEAAVWLAVSTKNPIEKYVQSKPKGKNSYKNKAKNPSMTYQTTMMNDQKKA